MVHALAPFSVLFVGVLCSLDELERREVARGDRSLGLARGMITLAHEHAVYDLTVDTAAMTAGEFAQAIKARLVSGTPPDAFEKLRARL